MVVLMFTPPKRAKVVLVGETGVGKTSIINRFIKKTFTEIMEPTIAGAQATVLVESESRGEMELDIWDTAGQERYRSVVGVFFRNAAAVVLVYDVSKKHSFDELLFWAETVRQSCDTHVLIYIAGNKIDEEHREVTEQEARLFAQSIKAHSYVECSAKTGDGVVSLFERIINDPGLRCDTETPAPPPSQSSCC